MYLVLMYDDRKLGEVLRCTYCSTGTEIQA